MRTDTPYSSILFVEVDRGYSTLGSILSKFNENFHGKAANLRRLLRQTHP